MTLRYVFRPSLFQAERVITLEEEAITSAEGERASRRLAWGRILEVHLEPATAGDDQHTRWLINLRADSGEKIQIDSVNVRGTADFEHKTEEFFALLTAIHRALAPYPGVRFLIGSRRGILVAWRIALAMLTATGLFATGAAIVVGDFESLFVTLAMAGFGLSGLAVLRGRRGPVPYQPQAFAAAAGTSESVTSPAEPG
jgi:hypothetical protein